MKEFAAAEWGRALRALVTARGLVDSDPDAAASRAYYAAFHGATAMFALQGQSFSKHSGLRAAVHQELIRSGKWPVELGQAYDFLLELRETGDYGGMTSVSPDSANTACEKALTLLRGVHKDYPELGTDPDSAL